LALGISTRKKKKKNIHLHRRGGGRRRPLLAEAFIDRMEGILSVRGGGKGRGGL